LFNRRPMFANVAAQAALLLALASGNTNAAQPSSERGQRRVDPTTKAGRRLNSKQYRNRGSYFDPKRCGQGQALRNRMGGNANRIRYARQGFIWRHDLGAYDLSPKILPEEVEAKRIEMARTYFCASVHDLPPVMNVLIRKWAVTIYPRILGPVRYHVEE